MTEELYKKHRPASFQDVVGQKEAIASLIAMGKSGSIPHTLLFTGPSGCGKTTLARIIKKKMGCSDIDFHEINASESRGIDTIRQINSVMGMAPLSGKCRIWLIDEAQALTADAQNAFLKMLEDTQKHCYFILATTDPQKLKKTIITRSTEIRCKEISVLQLKRLAIDTAEKEGVELSPDVAARMAEVADGSARKVMVILHQVIGITDVVEQMASIDTNDTKGQAISIVRALYSGASWKEVSKILSTVDDNPEGIRMLVLSWCASVLLKSGDPNAAKIMEAFQYNFFDTKKSGLVLACWAVVGGRS